MSFLLTTSVPTIPVNEYKSDPVLENAVKHATENCKPQIQDTGALMDAQVKGMAEVMQKMDIKACKWDKKSRDIKGGGVICCPPGVMAVGGKEVEQTSEGCEQINVASSIVSQCSQQLACMLNQASANTTTNVKVYQSIRAKFLGNVKGNVTIKNQSDINLKTLNLTQSSVQSAIGATITAGINDTLEQLQKTKNEAFSDPVAQKSYQSSLANLQQVASNTTINQSVANTTANLSVNQEIVVEVYKDVDGNFTLGNENALTLLCENYVYNALDQVLKTEAGIEFVRQIKQSSEQENTGVSTDVDLSAFTNAFSNLISNIADVFKKGISAGSTVIIAYIIGVVVIIGGLIYLAPTLLKFTPLGMFSGGGGKKQQNKQQQRPLLRRR